ncbi:tetratricopeptide repeat protein [Formicincola oecophyllae]|uniref:Tetratricopeptide repeat protein n=1 Tax=Formicincola oecophyllae TaxID=2558361 RepID=A0A4Y6U852_9PROT|nr:tetratricopeptide repeat protein [Formicincola oecophyllae]QDH13613.1 tetratricopeptide repeat protein [Formicincola oecophyllae]
MALSPKTGAALPPMPGSDGAGLSLGQQPTGTAPKASTTNSHEPPIKTTNEASFVKDVIEASVHTPIIVDFRDPAQPASLEVGQQLETIIKPAGGRIRLVSVDLAANKALANDLRQMGLPLHALPLVGAFWQGRMVDLLRGKQTPRALRSFVEAILKASGQTMPAAETIKSASKALDEGKPAEAASLASQILEEEPDNAQAWGLLVRALLALDDVESAEEALTQVPEAQAGAEPVKSAAKALALHKESAQAASDLEGIESLAAQKPDDFELHLKLASALNGAGEREKAADTLLALIKKGPAEQAATAKAELLRFFEGWGMTDPATMAARQKLSALLFA